MSSPVSRQIDLSSGHSIFPPRIAQSASHNVFVNSMPCLNVGTIMALHCVPMCMEPGCCHNGIIVQGSKGKVYVNGMRIGVIRSKIVCTELPIFPDINFGENCGDEPLPEDKYDEYITTGSPNVFAPSVP